MSWLTDLSVTDEIIKTMIGYGDEDVTDRYRHVSLEPKRKALTLLQETYLAAIYTPTESQERERARSRAGAAPHRRKTL